ncbi:hypothetical protein LRD69_11660 [Streptomyces sp. JH14]|uniref:hypothetical protein n=1 Tax=Streptomyces sp. JH14 TaxID=2793630 RepID=UPI0023F772AC|nr:hypothetical protein [Streptomyces sp. JH14]MDF6042800.1 hypothetical protein [Streptomyces sp. JH14]
MRFRLYQTLSCPIPGRSGFRFPGSRFRVSLSGASNVTRLFFAAVSGSNLIPAAFGVALPFGGFDIIRSISAELIGFIVQIRESTALQEFNFQ